VIGQFHREAADFADSFGHAFKQLRTVLHDPVRAVSASGLLIGQEQ
jgi:hypothetical protein